MPFYECVFIARQDISSQQVETLTESLSTIITEGGGQVTKSEYWGLRTLAYRIKKNRKGHYVLFDLEAPSETVQEMERNMRINEDVLRYLTLKVDALEEGPSIQMQSRHGRDDRGRGRRDDRGPRRDDRGPRRDDRGPRRDDRGPRRDAPPTETKSAPAAPNAVKEKANE